MKKNTVEIVITSILAIILIIAVVNIFKTKKKISSKRIAKVVATEEAQPQKKIVTTKKTFKALEDRAKDLKWERDPFVYKPRSIKLTEGFRLEGIVWDEEDPKAVINGNILSIGDKIDGKEIVDIRKDGVTLDDGKNILELHWSY